MLLLIPFIHKFLLPPLSFPSPFIFFTPFALYEAIPNNPTQSSPILFTHLCIHLSSTLSYSLPPPCVFLYTSSLIYLSPLHSNTAPISPPFCGNHVKNYRQMSENLFQSLKAFNVILYGWKSDRTTQKLDFSIYNAILPITRINISNQIPVTRESNWERKLQCLRLSGMTKDLWKS